MEGTPCCLYPDDCCGGTDCNENGSDDLCDIDPWFDGTSVDCNNNDIPDECDVAEGTPLNCDYEEYVHDALGRRIARIVHVPGGNPQVTHYYYDGQNVIEETDENETLQRQDALALVASCVNGTLNASALGAFSIDERVVLHDAVTGDEYYYLEKGERSERSRDADQGGRRSEHGREHEARDPARTESRTMRATGGLHTVAALALTYDANGNVTPNDDGLGYGHDFENRLVGVFEDTDGDGVYDPPGEALMIERDYDTWVPHSGAAGVADGGP